VNPPAHLSIITTRSLRDLRVLGWGVGGTISGKWLEHQAGAICTHSICVGTALDLTGRLEQRACLVAGVSGVDGSIRKVGCILDGWTAYIMPLVGSIALVGIDPRSSHRQTANLEIRSIHRSYGRIIHSTYRRLCHLSCLVLQLNYFSIKIRGYRYRRPLPSPTLVSHKLLRSITSLDKICHYIAYYFGRPPALSADLYFVLRNRKSHDLEVQMLVR